MQTYHIHIRGRVQGVGFRPFAAALAESRKLRGTVSNGMDGVHICLQTCETFAREYLEALLVNPPQHAIITGWSMELSGMARETSQAPLAPDRPYGLHILESSENQLTHLLLTPDIGLCADCRQELTDPSNRRSHYAFTTCLHCGPRYSILKALPYDRPHTTMAELQMCPLCEKEYTDIHHRRHFSQTNSCPDCAIPMHWYLAPGEASVLTREPQDQEAVIRELAEKLLDGQTVAVKGIGGYLLLCDATNPAAVARLRQRKHRPHKPLAVLYPDLQMAKIGLQISSAESEALQSPVAPIVLCKSVLSSQYSVLSSQFSVLSTNVHPPSVFPATAIRHLPSVVGTLHRVGVMLPYSPLLAMIASYTNRPLVATSGNLSGSPILYRDEAALDLLWELADAILTYDRDIVVPQDDSVWQFTDKGERIVLRRSRGMAPDHYPHRLGLADSTVFAAGADLKSAFALHQGDTVYISQYLGDLEDYRSQQAWHHTRDHLFQLLNASPALVLTDAHPAYFSRQEAHQWAAEHGVPVIEVPHHEAHIAAVMEENKLLDDPQPLLGLAWDGTGYGSDGQAWGSEGFIVQNGAMDRVLHLDYFPQLMGDKMSREPRLSALSLLQGHHDARKILQDHFTGEEWRYYEKIMQQPSTMLTSSMGRLIDGIASILNLCQHNTYEGQAAMELEALADRIDMEISIPYPFTIRQDRIDWRPMITVLLGDLYSGVPKEMIARRFFASLAQLVIDCAWSFDIPRIALSGGVFQNALLLDMIRDRLPADHRLFTHQQLSPNDECISLGQLAWYRMKSRIADFENRK